MHRGTTSWTTGGEDGRPHAQETGLAGNRPSRHRDSDSQAPGRWGGTSLWLRPLVWALGMVALQTITDVTTVTPVSASWAPALGSGLCPGPPTQDLRGPGQQVLWAPRYG